MSKILVVDDVPSELGMIGRILKNTGMEVVEAIDGERAIARIRESVPDLDARSQNRKVTHSVLQPEKH